MDVVNNPHDKFFKDTFKRKENLIDLLRNTLSKELFESIDFDKLEYCDESYINDELKEVHSDLLVKGKVNNCDCKFYILFEHKSYESKFSLLQLLNYMLKIWQVEINNNVTYLTPIIPVLFYQSGKVWAYGDNFSCYFNVEGLLSDYLPNIKYLIYDLEQVDDETLDGNYWFKLSIGIMKYIRKLKPYLEHLLDDAFSRLDLSNPNVIDKINILILYVLYGSVEKEEKYIERILKNKGGEVYMSLAQKLIQEGEQIGIQKGREEGREEGEQIGIQKGKEETLKELYKSNIITKEVYQKEIKKLKNKS
jgi:predicted transposase/invertase (TIGR01784 family)